MDIKVSTHLSWSVIILFLVCFKKQQNDLLILITATTPRHQFSFSFDHHF